MGTIQHAKFLVRLHGSRPGVWAFGYWLNGEGYWTLIPPIKAAPTAAEHKKFIDKGDLFAWKEEGPRRKIEVKTIGKAFSCARDWPYPEVFVAAVPQVIRSIGETYAWVSVSNDLRAAVIIKEKTCEAWYPKKCLASNTGNEEWFYACPLDQVKFVKL